jgi:lipopolysaccharide export system permease protein
MNILDKYLLKKFLVTYLFVALVIVLIICVIDYTEKIDNFRKTNPSSYQIWFEYYFNLIPYWANYISPLMVFISTVFFTARIAAHTEIVAMLSSGMSFLRIMVPYLMGAVILAVFTFYMVGWVIPRANKVRLAFENKYIEENFYFSKRNYHFKVAPTQYAYLESYDVSTQTGKKFTLERIIGNQLQEKLVSNQIVWNEKKKKWTIETYRIRVIDGEHEALTLTQLNDYIDLLKLRGADGVETYLLEKYARFTQPFAIIILTGIGLIVSARKSRRGTGLQIALGFALAFVYLLFFMLSKGVAESGKINTILAVWLPNIIFATVGVVLYKTLPR